MVARDDAPVAIVFATDDATDPEAEIIATFPDDTHPPIRFPVAMLAQSHDAEAADSSTTLNRRMRSRFFISRIHDRPIIVGAIDRARRDLHAKVGRDAGGERFTTSSRPSPRGLPSRRTVCPILASPHLPSIISWCLPASSKRRNPVAYGLRDIHSFPARKLYRLKYIVPLTDSEEGGAPPGAWMPRTADCCRSVASFSDRRTERDTRG